MTRFLSLLPAFVLAGFAATAAPRPALPPDSIGVEYRNNKMFIKHRVVAGETLYGLSRRYAVPVEQIVETNSTLKGALITGQVVLVPRTRVVMITPASTGNAATRPSEPANTAAAARSLPTDNNGNRVYTVQKGQTLYAVARLFQLPPADLARFNGLPATTGVKVGQRLIIVPAGAPKSPATASATVAAPPVAPVETPAPATPAPTSAPVATVPKPVVTPPAPVRPTSSPTNTKDSVRAPAPPAEERVPERASEIVRRVTESGLATKIEGTGTDKYLALHKTAAVGTIMQVRNIMNGQSVYVRVIGQLPDTGENSNILVRLSPRAVQRLSTPDNRFRVETSYVP
ncbi:Peptidoglycan-binding LysM [Hymenobacter roseosalivarius DSM 11622]|uniref:Peptidoglycan-binding LysM n=1 Tax=Hymenobacter roseosalivarius DSM 11622 TaxID=645990 RepID=A0A1W1VZI5_9BACT|nr:LysM peptidoglycan-binding domain-containing protein [Hymenobacter roseosalivarius]SMB98758.1 Peptidoglycan-binding LysM [Hymenobacter roseosalivarius DSM 11622]